MYSFRRSLNNVKSFYSAFCEFSTFFLEYIAVFKFSRGSMAQKSMDFDNVSSASTKTLNFRI